MPRTHWPKIAASTTFQPIPFMGGTAIKPPTTMKGINMRGVREFCRVLVQRPHLLLPHLSVRDVSEIRFQELKSRGIQGVIFDKDNTLSVPYQMAVAPQFKSSLMECQRVFGGENVVIFSNSAGSPDDVGFVEATRVEQSFNCAVLRHQHKKPGGIEDILQHFESVEPQRLMIVGDRYSTDVLFGNLHGLYTVRTEQFTHEGESWLNLGMQVVESQIVKWLVAKGRKAVPHPIDNGWSS